MSFGLLYKAFLSRNYYSFFQFKDLEGCKLTKIAANNPMIRPLLVFINETFQGIIRECPYLGQITLENATFNTNSKAIADLHTVQIFPNGMYKIWVSIFSKKDPNIANITVFFDVYYRYSVLNNNEDF